MKASIRDKLDRLADRHQELSGLLSDPEVIADQESFRRLSKEFADTEPVIRDLEAFRQAESELAAAREMTGDADPGIRELGEEEQLAVQERLEKLEARLLAYLVPRDPYDDANIFLEIRAGTGGDEAALFAGDLFRMYSRYAEARGWRVETLSASEGEHGGFREIISRVVGNGAYSRLKFESGAHRVQRVPETESQGRIHTSACTVAVLPELDEVEAVTVDASELRVDTYRSSGAGGQHVNKTDSAVRLTHLPTGIVVECQEERSQHKNRARAMALLQAKLTDERRRAQDQAQAAERKSLVGSGDRSERIRTYNFPQGRITDHRINLTLYKLDSVIQGDLEAVIEPLLQEHQAALMGQVSGD